MHAWRIWLRSVRGQLYLLGATFIGAVVLAVVIVCLRGVVFERYVREVYPAAGPWADEAARDLAAREISPDRLAKIREEASEYARLAGETSRPAPNLEELYGVWVLNPDLDPDGLVAVRLTQCVPDWVVGRLRRTLAAGSPVQRERALTWLRAITALDDMTDRVRELANQARQRAAARGEESIRLQAETVLASGRLADGR